MSKVLLALRAGAGDKVVLSKEEYEQLISAYHNLLTIKTIFERFLCASSSGKKMFSIITRTWNPVTGCLHGCKYCWARKLALTKLRNKERYAKGFIPRLNEGEFKVKFNEGEMVFVSDMGDLFGNFIPREWIVRVINHIRRFPRTFFLFLTKNPQRYEEFIDIMPENAILGATIETNSDVLYIEHRISKAPLPSVRIKAMIDLTWDKKFISIEPVLDFDLETFLGQLMRINPIMIYIGYDNYGNRLPEPPLSKVLALIERLSKSPILVITKTLRQAWSESLVAYVEESPCQGQTHSNGSSEKSPN